MVLKIINKNHQIALSGKSHGLEFYKYFKSFDLEKKFTFEGKWREMTALVYSAKKGHIDCLRVLLDAGADVNAKNEDGNTSLIYSAKKGHTDCLSALLDAGADVNAKDKNGVTSLMYSARNGHSDCLRALLDAEADVNAKDNFGKTSLDVTGNGECARLLREKAAEL